jgi:ribosomal protein L11 methyltransferase
MHQLRVQTNAYAVERVENLLFNCGAVSISYQDAEDEPILEPPIGDHPMWSCLYIQAHFQTADQINLASKALQHEESIGSQILLEQIDDDGWQEKFQQQFTAMQFGPLWIYPSWEKNPNPDGTSLKLDPGLAFGTGQHATTHLCLQWLSEATLKDMEVIDFGCGSGILALAAAALGAKHVYAVDIDPQALTATQQNIQQNQMSTGKFTIDRVEALDKVKADILVANILAEPLMKLRDSLLQHLKPNGTLLLSGILSTQVEDIIEHYSALCSHQVTTIKGDWSSIIFKPVN